MPPFAIPLGVNRLEGSAHIHDEELRLSEQLKDIISSKCRIDAPVNVIERSITYYNWAVDGRVAYDPSTRNDKFAALVGVSKKYSVCENYYSDTLCVNAATVWRWASNKTRPSKIFGARLADEIRCILLSCVADDIDLLSIRSKAVHETMR